MGHSSGVSFRRRLRALANQFLSYSNNKKGCRFSNSNGINCHSSWSFTLADHKYSFYVFTGKILACCGATAYRRSSDFVYHNLKRLLELLSSMEIETVFVPCHSGRGGNPRNTRNKQNE